MKKLLILLLLPSIAVAKPKAAKPEPVSIRPFVGADLVWSMRGAAALGPDSGPAIERTLTTPPELTPDCKVGDLTLQATSVEIAVNCQGSQPKLSAQLRAGASPFEVIAPANADAVTLAVQKELQKRLDAHAAEIPLRHPAARPMAGTTELQGPVGLWQRAADAMLAGDLSAAVTATDVAIVAGPAELTPPNRLDAAIVATALGKFAKVKSWLGDPKKSPASDAEAMAVRVLLGKRAEVLAIAEKCVSPQAVPACDVKPLLRALVAQKAWPEAARLLDLRIGRPEPDLDDVRLALGVADLAHDATATLKYSQLLVKLRPDDPVGWQTAARTLAARGQPLQGLTELLTAPEAVAKSLELQELVVALLDLLLDPLSPNALDAAAQATLSKQIAASTTTIGRLAQAVLEGWHGDIHAAEQLAALPESESAPTLLALRGMALLAAGQMAQVTPLLARALAMTPLDPRVAELQLLVAIAAGKPTDEAENAYEDAEVKAARVGSDFRLQRARVAAQLRMWGLAPPPRWPVQLP